VFARAKSEIASATDLGGERRLDLIEGRRNMAFAIGVPAFGALVAAVLVWFLRK
jgi:hypothetical protein